MSNGSTQTTLLDAHGQEITPPEIITPSPVILEGATTQSTTQVPIAPVKKTTRPTIVSLAYAREAAMSMIPILGTIRYAQYASKDGLTAGEMGWIAASAALDLLCIIPIARIGAGVGVSTIRAARIASAATKPARIAKVVSTTARTTRTIGPVTRTGNTQLRLVTNLRNAIDSGNAGKIRVAATKLENFGNTTPVRKLTGGTDISKKAAYIRENADVLAKTKIPTRVKETLNRLDEAFAPYRGSRQRLLHPKGAGAATEVARPGVRAKTAVVPITREEARGFGLSSKQVDDIFTKVGENRAAYVREAEATRRANLTKVFEEINEIIRGATKQRTPHGRRGLPSKRTAQNRAAARAAANARTKAKVRAKKAEIDAYNAALHRLRISPALNPTKGRSPSGWQPFRPGELTRSRMNLLISRWQRMGADLAVRQMIAARLLTPALANNTAAITRILDAASTGSRTRALTQLSPTVRTALQNNQIQQTTNMAQAETDTMIRALTRAEAMAQIATLTETLARTTTEAEEWEKTGTSIATLNRLKILNRLAAETRDDIITATKVVEDTETGPFPKTGTVTSTRVPPPGEVTSKPPPPKPPPPKPRPRLRLRLPPGETYARLSVFQKQGAVAWKQGFIYKLIYPPYGQNDVINSKKPIPGVRVVSGAKSAYESIIKTRGAESQLPSRITRDMGIMDIEISTPGGGRGKPKLRFKKDARQRTKTTPNAGISSVRR